MTELLIADCKRRIASCFTILKKEFDTIPDNFSIWSVLYGTMLPVHGTHMPLQKIASWSGITDNKIHMSVHDREMVDAVKQVISDTGLVSDVQVMGRNITFSVNPISVREREGMVSIARKHALSIRSKIDNILADATQAIYGRYSEIPEEERPAAVQSVRSLCDEAIATINTALAEKEDIFMMRV